MKILIADEDRDFLSTYQRLLQVHSYEVVTAFDGTQVIQALGNGTKYDLLILSRSLPRIPAQALLETAQDRQIPVVMLLRERVRSDWLTDSHPANAYIGFPFFPDELTGLIGEVVEKSQSQEQLEYDGVQIDIGRFLLCGKLRVTNEEINIIRTLKDGQSLSAKRAEPYIHSLNHKLEQLGLPARIRYMIRKGYRMVTSDE